VKSGWLLWRNPTLTVSRDEFTALMALPGRSARG